MPLTTPAHTILQHRIEHKTIAHTELTLLRASVANARERADLRIHQLMLIQQYRGIGSQPALQERTAGLAMTDMQLETQRQPFTPMRSPL